MRLQNVSFGAYMAFLPVCKIIKVTSVTYFLDLPIAGTSTTDFIEDSSTQVVIILSIILILYF